MCLPRSWGNQVWPQRSEHCGRAAPTNVACAECIQMCTAGGKNSVSQGHHHRVQSF